MQRKVRFALWLMAIACGAVALGVAAAPPAWAVDASRVASSMAQQAAKAYESGDYPRAAELYLSAFRTDANSAFLYGAARSNHVGGRTEQAAQLYTQFLTAAGADPERKTKAQGYLNEISEAKVFAMVGEADRVRAEDPKLAASMYLDAIRLVPSRLDLLFKAGVAEQQAGDLTAAETRFGDYLKRAPADAPERNQATARLDSIRRKLHPDAKPPVVTPEPPKPEPARSEPVPTPPPPVAPPRVTAPPVPPSAPVVIEAGPRAPAESSPTNWAGWGVTGGGAVLAITGVALLIPALSDLSAYNADLAKTTSSGLIVGTHEDASARASSINTQVGIAAALGGVGIVAAGVGTWMLLKTPAKAALAPVPGGMQLVVRF